MGGFFRFYNRVNEQFAREIGENKADEAIISSIITIANNMGLRMIAEGVETKKTIKIFTKIRLLSNARVFI